jgi:hypothetical protein
MITRQEEEKIQILSDTELYPQAVEFMHGIARKLPTTQINGLLNVSLANTYEQLKEFVDHQYNRTTWKANERHIPEFYRRLTLKFKDLDKYALSILALRTEKASTEDQERIKMAIAREFIQHLLAENDYMIATQAFLSTDGAGKLARAGNQERPEDGRRGSWQNRGGTRQ